MHYSGSILVLVIILEEEEKAGCLAIIVSQMYCHNFQRHTPEISLTRRHTYAIAGSLKMVILAATSYLKKLSHEKKNIKKRCFHAYRISTGTASASIRQCFKPSCSHGRILGSSSSYFVSCGLFSLFLTIFIFPFSYWFGKLKQENIDR